MFKLGDKVYYNDQQVVIYGIEYSHSNKNGIQSKLMIKVNNQIVVVEASQVRKEL